VNVVPNSLYFALSELWQTNENESLLLSMGRSVKGQGKGSDNQCLRCCVLYWQSASVEKSLCVLVGKLSMNQRYVLPNHMQSSTTRSLAIRIGKVIIDLYSAFLRLPLVYCVWFQTSCCKWYISKLAEGHQDV